MIRLFYQAVRFLGIGFLNTAVDFAVLNFFATLFGIYQGLAVGLLNIVSFTAAVIHSFFWNKYWAFAESADTGFFRNVFKFAAAAILGVAVLAAVIWGSREQFGIGYYLGLLAVLAIGEIILWKAFKIVVATGPSQAKQELLLFVVISIVGTLINSGLVVLLTRNIEPMFGINRELWLNLAKAAATAISLVWNFLGYKLVVFKR